MQKETGNIKDNFMTRGALHPSSRISTELAAFRDNIGLCPDAPFLGPPSEKVTSSGRCGSITTSSSREMKPLQTGWFERIQVFNISEDDQARAF
jgi:hypothetical protein